MSEYIERYKAMDEINKWLDSVGNVVIGKGLSYYGELMGCLQDVPAADVAEVMHGKWLLECEPNGEPYCYHCSVCDDDFHYIGITTASDYCPHCGAKMDFGGDEE